MSFMLKIAFAVQLTVAGALGLGGTTTSTSTPASAPTEQSVSGPVQFRPTCDACDSAFDSCIDQGFSAAACRRMTANCYKNCQP